MGTRHSQSEDSEMERASHSAGTRVSLMEHRRSPMFRMIRKRARWPARGVTLFRGRAGEEREKVSLHQVPGRGVPHY